MALAGEVPGRGTGFNPDDFDAAALLKRGLRNVFDRFTARQQQGIYVDPDLFRLTYQALADAIDTGYGSVGYSEPTRAFVDGLKVSTAAFAARKSYAQALDLARLIDNGKGSNRSWAQYRKLPEVQAVLANYNQRWLKTEYYMATRSCRAMRDYQQYQEPSHLRMYPNLRYTASRAATPREEHKPYYGVVRPVNDDFWTYHLPPIAFNCLCGVEPCDEAVTEVPPNGPTPAPGLDNNGALSGTIINLGNPEGPYYPGQAMTGDVDAAGRKALLKQLRQQTLQQLDQTLIAPGLTVDRPGMGVISFTKKGLKECINQPHAHYLAKLDFLQEGLLEALTKGAYAGTRPNDKPQKKPLAVAYHYIECRLAGESSFLVIEENKKGEWVLYTIVDALRTP